MEASELIRRVRRVELRARGLSSQIFSGEYHSAFKGRGMAFSENRAYQHGDEIRTIDWNVTARMRSPYVKVFEEERELTAMLLIDVSASGKLGSREKSKRELAAELAAVLAFSAGQNNDKIGAILFSDRIERFIPPKKGRSHILRIVREIIDLEPEGTGTDITSALEHFGRVMKKRTIAFLISDLQDTGFGDILKRTSRRHDLVALQLVDDLELKAAKFGWLAATDPESGRAGFIDTSSMRWRKRYTAAAQQFQTDLVGMMKRSGVDHAVLNTAKPYVQPLMQLFDRRG
ncbi:MAG TPA: DUF58 domain-containing protein [Flavobacteriales bacterium]|mgnify:FL=1|jgi:uncharacterized protein (DUF58 family)|nr:DUF58 domain-containing protein [Flavobacteriales bacterium]